MDRLQRIEIEGFKSIRMMDLELRPLNVLIGANGAGKSNLVSYFRMLNYMSTGALQEFVGRAGGADSLLHFGAKRTPQMSATLNFETDTGTSTYHHRLVHAALDSLIFAEERTVFLRPGARSPQETILGSGHKESLLPSRAQQDDRTSRVFHHLLRGCQVFQFHDTSETAYIRGKRNIDDNRFLYDNAGNLAAVLYRLQQTKPEYYRRIVAAIQQIAPFFRDFDLAPDALNPKLILLNWRARDPEFLFGPHQLSDGTLRTMALFTLLLQPEEDLPRVILLDEPELGLHPSAIQLLGSLLRSVATHHQVIVATQSVAFVDQFDPGDVVVVELRENSSEFQRQDSEKLKDWLEQYSLGELWQKNVIGGRP
ncbi:MAG: DUF2813 domain-containing protein [Planctomycetes bacterium]|nr:DUF2813 domain-containing protein [Planctomycetota bacterium]